MSSVENILPKKQVDSSSLKVRTVFYRFGKKLRKVSRWAVAHIEYGLKLGTAIGIADDVAAIAENVFKARWVGQAIRPLHVAARSLGVVFAPLWFIAASLDLYGEFSSKRKPAESLEELGQRVFKAASTAFWWGESIISLGLMVCSFISSAIAVIPILGLVESILCAPAALFGAVSQVVKIKNLEEKKQQDSERLEHRKLWHKLAETSKEESSHLLDGLKERYRIKLMKIDAKFEAGALESASPILRKKKLRTIERLQQIDRHDVAGLIAAKRLRMTEIQGKKLTRAVRALHALSAWEKLDSTACENLAKYYQDKLDSLEKKNPNHKKKLTCLRKKVALCSEGMSDPVLLKKLLSIQKRKIKSISKHRKKWVKEKEIRERHLSCLSFPNSTKALITERFALLLDYRAQEAKTQLKNRKIQQKRAILGVVANVSICGMAVTGTVLGAVALSGVGLPILLPVAISLAWGTISLTKFLINKFVFKEKKAPSLEEMLHEQEVKEKI